MSKGTNIKVKIDPVLLQNISSTGKNGIIISQKIRDLIRSKIDAKQESFISNFYQHPISQEISSGPNASNTSGTLGGYGNLFAFLGFESGEDPLEVIEEIFRRKIRYKVTGRNRGKFLITLYIPQEKEVYKATPMPWASNMSWSESIEKGVSNAAAFLFNPKGFTKSSSGTGLQSKNNISGVKFNTTPYISKLLEEFKKDLNQL